MLADEQPSQAGTAGDRDQAEGAEEPAPDPDGTPGDGPNATQDPAEGAAETPG
jgi:hypothetical protein